ncbi:MAG: PsbP-related protein [Halobacteriota archaeon]
MGTNTRMHLAIIIVAAAAVAASSAGCTNPATQSPTPGAPASFLLYSNKNAGVEINYPSDWQLIGGLVGGNIATFEHANQSTIFQMQRSTLNQSIKTSQSVAPIVIGDLLKSNQGVSLLENHTASLGGQPGYQIVFTFKTSGGQLYKQLEVWAIKGNSLYTITFSGTATQYDEQIGTAQQMISSFRFA